MSTNAAALIQILRESLAEVEANSKSHIADIGTIELKQSLLLAIDELELMRTGSHQLQAA